MPKFNNLVGILAISAALTGGAVTLGTAVAATSANAATVMGGFVGGGGYPYPYNANYNRNRNKQGQKHKAANKNKNKNKNKTKQWQHERQNQGQHQFLLRDFTLVLTPFQKTDTDARALPYNWQYGTSQSYPYTRTNNFSDQFNRPEQDQESAVQPKSNQATEVNPEVEEKYVGTDTNVDMEMDKDKDKDKDKKKHHGHGYDGYDGPAIAY